MYQSQELRHRQGLLCSHQLNKAVRLVCVGRPVIASSSSLLSFTSATGNSPLWMVFKHGNIAHACFFVFKRMQDARPHCFRWPKSRQPAMYTDELIFILHQKSLFIFSCRKRNSDLAFVLFSTKNKTPYIPAPKHLPSRKCRLVKYYYPIDNLPVFDKICIKIFLYVKRMLAFKIVTDTNFADHNIGQGINK